MNATIKEPPVSESSTASPGVVILVHFELPAVFSKMLDIDRPAQFVILGRGLEHTLRASGLLIEGTLTGAGALSEGLLIFTTPERNRAITAVKNLIDACGLFGPFIEIAWQCRAEGILRTCWPLGPTKPFDRHLDDAAAEQRSLIMKAGLAEANRET